MTDQQPAEQDTGTGGNAQFSGTFEDLDLPTLVLEGLDELGYKKPTTVQAEVYAPVREGRDVIVQSRTGSGKTTAFCLPVIASINAEEDNVQAIALCPTRELANQVAEEATALGKPSRVKVAAIYGGASMQKQIQELEDGAQFVVGTPGRVMDMIRRGHLRAKTIKFAILDEADEMLSMGFWEEVTGILDQLPKARQNLLFSATLPPEIERAASQYLKEPERIDLSRDSINVSTIEHKYVVADDKLARPRNFLYVIEAHRPQNAIVFCNRRDETELVCRYLARFGYRAEALNGDMPQRARERVLARVKAGELDMMVATDVAARGIDISDLGHVFNYDLPEFDEVYVHRVGRTGRIGKKGVAVSLVRGRYLTHLTSLKRDFGVPFIEVTLPSEQEILHMQSERIAEKIKEEAEGVEIAQYQGAAELMLEREDAKDLLAFLLRSHFKKPPRAPAPERSDRDGDRGGRRDRDDRKGRGRGRDRDDDRRSRGRDREDDDGDEAEDGEPSAQVNLYVTLGQQDDIDDLTRLIEVLSDMSGVDAGHFTGKGDVRDLSSHVEVDREVHEKVIEGVHGKLRPGAEAAAEEDEDASDEGEDGEDRPRKRSPEITCEPARPRGRRRRRPSGGGRGGPRRGRR